MYKDNLHLSVPLGWFMYFIIFLCTELIPDKVCQLLKVLENYKSKNFLFSFWELAWNLIMQQ